MYHLITHDGYMHGMYNGMEFILSIIEEREPVFLDAPEKWSSRENNRTLF